MQPCDNHKLGAWYSKAQALRRYRKRGARCKELEVTYCKECDHYVIEKIEVDHA